MLFRSNYLQKKYVKKSLFNWLVFAAKAVWFDCAMLLSWYVLTSMAGMTFPDWITEFLYLVIFAGGTLFFVAYDYMIILCQRSVDLAVRRIRR